MSKTNKTEVNTELRNFGFIMGVMFALMFGLLFPLIGNKTFDSWPIWPFVVMSIFWLVALSYPLILKPVNNVWIKIGDVLGFINSRIILGIMFFLLIFPIGLILKILGKDSMNRRFNKKIDSYKKPVIPRDPKHLEKPF